MLFKPDKEAVHGCSENAHFHDPGSGDTIDGTNRSENITDWALSQFQKQYGEEVTKWDIFHYIYAMLHHPQYSERYAENLKRNLPHIPLLHTKEAFLVCVSIGKKLMETHLNYEQAVVTVSIETVKLVNELAKAFNQDDWMSKITTELTTHFIE
jgi:predicted helicase